jgi:leukotriene-A4 hydrolase
MFTKNQLVCWLALGTLAFASACQNSSNPKQPQEKLAVATTDVHSFAQPKEVQVKHIALDLKVDFAQQVIGGKATLSIENKTQSKVLWLDSKNLMISKITLDSDEKPSTFELGEETPFLGKSVRVAIAPETKTVNIYYTTTPQKAEALQWLAPSQTAGKKFPFLFTQGQAILTRSWIPCQDSPGIRITYDARIQVPPTHLAVMSAQNPVQRNDSGVYHFTMKQPIPAYLIALAVGDVEFKAVGARTGVYAEPSTLPKAVYELAEMEQMLEAAEKLYGKYAWERYDLIVLPPSFPFGGMENPRLTFATPTILAGDRSLTSLVAHELAHSWSGNLVTNATWNDFWLNEGFTVYFERRIMEALYGKSYSDMLMVLGYQDLQAALQELDSNATRLKLDLAGKDPDDGMNDIAYEKGYCFLRNVEQTVGREKFDAFLKNYFSENAFGTIYTEAFLEYLKKNLLQGDEKAYQQLNVDNWVYKGGFPQSYAQPIAERFKNVDKVVDILTKEKKIVDKSITKTWTSHEWLHLLRHLPANTDAATMAQLDAAFGFTKSGNSELQFEWYMKSIAAKYTPAYEAMSQFMTNTGRRKFIVPLYKALLTTPEGKAMAQKIYAKARPNYHFVATNTLDPLLK